MTFGILTLATPSDYKKAIALALSARISNPGVDLAVAAAAKLRPLLAPYFDHFVEENTALKGFEHKVHIDRYSPFEDTFFFDSDVLLFSDLKPIAKDWAQQVYTASGVFRVDGFSSFGMDRKKILQRIGKPTMSVIDGAGHCYFRKPGCIPFFDIARDITARHKEFCGNIKYADEDVIDIAMTMMDLKPAAGRGFFARHMSAKPGTLRMSALEGVCSYVEQEGARERITASMMHFASNEAPFTYAKEMHALFSKFGVDTSGLYRNACKEFYGAEIKLRIRALVRKLLKKPDFT